jgi:hypothetical protein
MTNPYMMMGLQHEVMPPCGGHGRPFGPRPTFLGGCAQCVRAYMVCQFGGDGGAPSAALWPP